MMLTQARLKEWLRYDPSTGLFTRVKAGGGKAIVGTVISCKRAGYLQVFIEGHNYVVHRLAWLYMTGEWPKGQIDHINCERADNRWSNLRDVDQSTNMQNRKHSQTNSKTGVLGVSPSYGRFRAAIEVDGKFKHIGRFDTIEEAQAAHLRAKRQHHAGCTI